MNERILRLRKKLNLSRAAFGEQLGVSGDVINNLERGRVPVKEPMIKLICSYYHVDEKWLVSGEGGDEPVFVKPEKFSLDEFVKAHGGADNLELQIIKSYFELPKETRRMLVQHFQKGLAAASEDEERKSMREKAADLYDVQSQTEEKPDAPASSANESAVG